MFIAGLFGTVTGDLAHYNIGLYSASGAFCLALAGLVFAREARAPGLCAALLVDCDGRTLRR
jgi:hypothetical protein